VSLASLKEAIERLGSSVRTSADVAAISIKLDRIAAELAELSQFSRLEGAEDESLEGLLSYLDEMRAARLARALTELSSQYEDASVRNSANRQQRKLHATLVKLFIPVIPSPSRNRTATRKRR
jgi:hypothetical protein